MPFFGGWLRALPTSVRLPRLIRNNSPTLLRGNHGFKPVVDLHSWPSPDVRPGATLPFPTSAAYLAALDGANRFGYTICTQFFGCHQSTHQHVRCLCAGRLARTPDLKIRTRALRHLRVTKRLFPIAVRDSRSVPTSQQFAPVSAPCGAWAIAPQRDGVNTGLVLPDAQRDLRDGAANDGPRAGMATFTPTRRGAGVPGVLPGSGATPQYSGYVIRFQSRKAWQNTCSRALVSEVATGGIAVLCQGVHLPVITNINLLTRPARADGLPLFAAS